MIHIPAKSPQAKEVIVSVEKLQAYFVSKLDAASLHFGEEKCFEAVSWLRDEGRHGGGTRYESRDASVFDSASVNVSQIHYDDDEAKKLGSTTALSTIIHPNNPHAPSMHMHISWTQMKEGRGYWRVMADLNPSLIDESNKDKEAFLVALKKVAGVHYEEGIAQGERYFYIPVLGRHRGVSHFYLEDFNSGDFEADKSFVLALGQSVIESYMTIVADKLLAYPTFSHEEKMRQLDYHTLYLFQVLTLDRGTTSGLLVHDQNDIGIMGSIPSHINRDLLASWIEKMPSPQDLLLKSLLEVLPQTMPTPVNQETKKALATAVRRHYAGFPEALSMQASGESIPPTVANHC